MDKILQVQHLYKSYSRKQVLEDFNMSLDRGKVFGLLGNNGEGKTTLIRIIMGIIPADKGRIIYDGRAISFNQPAYKKEVAYIPEESIFFSWMSINELMTFNASFYPQWNAGKGDGLLQRFKLSKKLKIKNLSRGMKLKLGLIIALAAEPKLLILDDPTSGMDIPTRHDFLKSLIQEILEAGTSILFSSHIVHELEGIIDQLGILRNGRLILDEKFDIVKEQARKVRLDFNGPVPPDIKAEGLIHQQINGSRCELGIYPWQDNVKSQLAAYQPKRMEIDSMTLEEIFIHFVSD
jgi:ABC-2 type transport system ATP-binding protein